MTDSIERDSFNPWKQQLRSDDFYCTQEWSETPLMLWKCRITLQMKGRGSDGPLLDIFILIIHLYPVITSRGGKSACNPSTTCCRAVKQTQALIINVERKILSVSDAYALLTWMRVSYHCKWGGKLFPQLQRWLCCAELAAIPSLWFLGKLQDI